MGIRKLLCGTLFLLASVHVLHAQEIDERRLDTPLKLLLRAQSGAGAAAGRSATQADTALDLVQRLAGRAGLSPAAGRRADAAGGTLTPLRLSLLVRYTGDQARLEDVGFRVQARVGQIYTGSLEVERLRDLVALSDTVFVQASHELLANVAIPHAGFLRRDEAGHRQPADSAATGVLIGYVDSGVDIFHHDFRTATGETRIKALLDLSDPGDVDGDGELDGLGPFGGTLYTEADINATLTGTLLVQQKDTTGHGTHGLSIAAGDDAAYPGLAPGADLIVVKATRDDGTLSFTSGDLINALSFVDTKAQELGLPYVVNLSLGTLFGSHDGRSLEEQAIDAMFGPGIAGKAVVVAAGNSSDNASGKHRHFKGQALVGLESTHTLRIPSYATPRPGRGDDRVFLDLWYEGRDKHTLTVRPPAARTDCPEVSAPYGEYADVQTPCGDVFVANMGGANPGNGDTEALILIDDWTGPAPAAGDWTIVVEGEAIEASGDYDGWLLDDSGVGDQSPYLTTNSDNRHMVGKPGGAYNAITVGSYAKHDGATRFRTSWMDVTGGSRVDDTAVVGEISDFSSGGMTRDGRMKPEVTAPGERVLGAVSQDAYPTTAVNSIYRYRPLTWPLEALITDNTANRAFGLLQGTSFAAPVVTGLAARILSANPSLDAIQVRNILVNSVVVDGFVTGGGTRAVPNDVWGYGKVDEQVGTSTPLPSDLRITTDALPDGVKDKQYNLVLTASGGKLPYTWALTSGTLPPGVTFETSGFLTGKPTTAGDYTFTITVTDSTPGTVQTASRPYAVSIAGRSSLKITTTLLPVAHIDKPYQETLQAEGGTPPYQWDLAGGALPPGLTVQADGKITGVPTALGRFPVTLRVADATADVAWRSVNFRVSAGSASAWNTLGGSAPVVNTLAVDPLDENRVVASVPASDAVFETTDGGVTWRPITINNDFSGYAARLDFSRGTHIPWAQSTEARLFSLDRGAGGWTQVPMNQPHPYNGWILFSSVAFDASDAARVAVWSYNESWVWETSLFSSPDGRAWTKSGVIWPDGGCCAYLPPQDSRWTLSLAQQRPEVMYLGRPTGLGAHVLRSDDSGASWNVVTNGASGYWDIQASAQDPLGLDVILRGPGLSIFSSSDGGRRWQEHGVPASGTGRVFRRSESAPAVLLFGTSAGLLRSGNAGLSWSPFPAQVLRDGVETLEIAPTNVDVIYASTPHGLYRSEDGGQTWLPRSDGLLLRKLRAIAISAADPRMVAISAADGVYVSRGGGARWTRSSPESGVSTFGPIAVSPADQRQIYLGTDDGVRCSSNGGVTWSSWGDPSPDVGDQVLSVTADPFVAQRAIVALSGSKGLYQTSDGGATWTRADAGLPFTEPTEIAFAQDVAGRLYASFTSRGVFRSDDGGSSWSRFGPALSTLTATTIASSPVDSEYVYASVGPTMYFRPGSGDWQPATTSPAQALLDVAVDPTTTLIAYAGADHPGTTGSTGGLYKTTDGGLHWYRLTGVLDSFDVVSVATHPTESGIVYVATREGGAYVSDDGGLTWKGLAEYGTVADLTTTTVKDPSNPNVLFAGTEGYGIQASTDGGRTFVPRVSGLTNYYVNAIVFDPDTPATIYIGTDAGIYKSTDSGDTWVATGLASGRVTDLVTANDGATRRIWGTVEGQGVAASSDAGTTFTVSANGLASLELTSLEVDTTAATRRIWGTTKGGDGVVFSDDDGLTWRSAAGNGLTSRDVTDVKVQTGSTRRIWGTGKTIWATTNDGVYYSNDEGLSWSDLSLGLPGNTPVTSLAIDPSSEEVFVSLYSPEGGGVYRGGSLTGIWRPFNAGLEELKVKRLTHDGGRTIDAQTLATTFYASTSGDGVYAAEIQSTATGTSPSITTGALAPAFVKTVYSQTLAATDGTPPYVWTVSEGSLPPGLMLDGSAGTISGNPGQVGTYGFTVAVSDAEARTGTKSFALNVVDPLTVSVLSVGDVGVTEGNLGSVDAVFAVTLSTPATGTVTADFVTVDGTAVAPGDFAATNGSLTFTLGETAKTVIVPVVADPVSENAETFTLVLSHVSGAVSGKTVAVGTVLDDDVTPLLSVGPVVQAEGNVGTTSLSFAVTLSTASGRTVRVDYATSGGTATVGTDYTATGGALTFLPGETVKVVSVPVLSDLTWEPDETLSLVLSNPTNAAVGTATALGTIQNDDPVPGIAVDDVLSNEGDATGNSVAFTVSLSNPSIQTITVQYATANGTATAGSDYVTATGSLTYAPGQTTRMVTVMTVGDTDPEVNETLLLNLSSPTNAMLSDAQGVGTVVNDDGVPMVSVSDVSVSEGNSGGQDVSFVVTLSVPYGTTVLVDYRTLEGTASAGLDYVAVQGTLSFTPGVTSRTLTVTVLGDVLDEGDEAFTLALSNPVNAALTKATGAGTILDDDPESLLSVNNVTVVEGNAATVNAVFTVTLAPVSGRLVTVGYTTEDGTAMAPGDYAATNGTLTFGPGETTKTISVPVNGDTTQESDETFVLRLQDAIHAGVSSQGSGTIVTDDAYRPAQITAPAPGSTLGASATFTWDAGIGVSQYWLSVGRTLGGDEYYGASEGTGLSRLVIGLPADGKTIYVRLWSLLGTEWEFEDYSYRATAPAQPSLTPSTATTTVGQTVQVVVANGPGNVTDWVGLFEVNVPDWSHSDWKYLSGTRTAPGTGLTGATLSFTMPSTAGSYEFRLFASNGFTRLATSSAVTVIPVPSSWALWTNVVGASASGGSLTKTAGTSNWDAGAVSAQALNSGDGTVEFTATETTTYRALGLGNGDVNQGIADIEFGIALVPGSGYWVYESGSVRTAGSGTFVAGDKFSVGVESGVVKYRRNGVVFYTSTVAPTYPLHVDTSLYSPGSTITDARVVGFTEPPPALSVNDVSVNEGHAGTTTATFTVTLSPASASVVTVEYATSNGTATAGSDYVTASGTLTFTPGVTSQTFAVTVNGDTAIELDETFTVTLSSPTNATLGDGTGVGTIVNDELPPATMWTNVVGASASGGSLTKTAGTSNWDSGAVSAQTLNSGDGSVEFTATETTTYRALGLGNGDVNQGIADIEFGIALVPSSGYWVYESGSVRTAGSGTFAAGDRFSVSVESGLVKYRRNGVVFHTSTVVPTYPLRVDTSLYSPGSTITDARVTGLAEPPPSLSVNDVSVNEGNAGATTATFTVALSPASASVVTVDYATSNGTATAGSDYLTASGTLTFDPGITTQTFGVTVNGDTAVELDETFTVTLSSPTNATIGDGTGEGTIVNDELPPATMWTNVVGVSASGGSLTKTAGTSNWDSGAVSAQTLNSGDGSVEFTATETTTYRALGLGNGDTNQGIADIEFGIALVPGGGYWVYESGSARTAGSGTFAAGDRFSVGVESGAVKYRRNGVVFYTSTVVPTYPLRVDTSLYSPGSTITDARVVGLTEPIVNDDAPPAAQWQNLVGVAATGGSLTKTAGTSAWDSGAVSTQSLVSGDGCVEFTATETTTYRAVGLGTGDSNQGIGDIEYGIALTPGAGFWVYESGTARTAGSGTFVGSDRFSVCIEAGVVRYRRNGVVFYTSAVAPMYPLRVDTSLYSPGSTITDARVVGLAEPLPTLSISDASVDEGDSGTVAATFTVSLSGRSASPVTVDYETSSDAAIAGIGDGRTATPGSDYEVAGGTLTFQPGETTNTFTVAVNGDAAVEFDEILNVTLANATNAVVGTGTGTGTIVNDDAPPAAEWKNLVGVAANGGSLTKTAGTNGWDSGAVSTQSLMSGDGHVEFTATETTTYRMLGLGTGDSGPGYVDLEYAVALTPAGQYLVYESGVAKTGASTFLAGDRFTVGVESGSVRYRRNGSLFHTSTVAPTYPLLVDTSIYSPGATTTDARVLGFTAPATAAEEETERSAARK